MSAKEGQPERIAGATLHIGDCLGVLPQLAAEGFRAHAVVTDPPYGLGFMGKAWDAADNVAFRPETWAAVRDCMLPGAHLVAFGGTRTFHRMVCAIEDAGFEIRDTLMWITGQGFPKSLDVSKAIDRAAGAEREVVGRHIQSKQDRKPGNALRGSADATLAWQHDITAPATPEAAAWAGWGTALKPSYEPIILARKPLSEGNVAANVLRHGTGAINVDACRVPTGDDLNGGAYSGHLRQRREYAGSDTAPGAVPLSRLNRGAGEFEQPAGRYPANLLHDGSPEVEQAFAAFGNAPGQSGAVTGNEPSSKTDSVYGQFNGRSPAVPRGDTGSASRFFYTAKADARDRAGSRHPTVKPASLMRWLVRLVTPPRVIELVCETCDNIPHGQSSMRSVQPAVSDPPEGVEVLLSPVSGGQHHYSENAMSGVRKDRGSSEGSSLLKGVSRPSAACSDAASEAVRALQDSVQAEEGWRETVLLSGMRSSGKRPSEAEAEHTDSQRLHGALPSRPSNGEQTGLRHGAPDDRGGEDRAAPASVRGGASRQRNKARQQAGKPSPDDEGRSRQDAKAAQAGGGVLPPLHGKDQADQQCPKCGGPLTRVERPGLVLDPFAGTGSTGLAADQCGMRSVLIERDPTYAGDALRKIREDAPLFASPAPDLDAAYQCHGDLFADAAD